MPYYVQRNWRGQIIGLFACPQPQPDGTSLTDPEPLADDHPEIVAHLAKLPPTPPVKAINIDEALRSFDEFEKVQVEHSKIRQYTERFNSTFSELEIALSALLYAVLNLPHSQIAHAIYYSPTSFDARVEIVNNALIQLITENKEALGSLLNDWEVVYERISKARKLRNAVAHSSPITHLINGKPHARLSPPAFDVIRIGRKLAARQIPGLSGEDIRRGIIKAGHASACVDAINRLISEFHDGNPSLQQRFAALKACLTTLRTPS